jgi:hypothetical protein
MTQQQTKQHCIICGFRDAYSNQRKTCLYHDCFSISIVNKHKTREIVRYLEKFGFPIYYDRIEEPK